MEIPKKEKRQIMEIISYRTWQQKTKKLNDEFECTPNIEGTIRRCGYKLIEVLAKRGRFSKKDIHKRIIYRIYKNRYNLFNEMFEYPIVYIERESYYLVFGVQK